MPTGYARSGVTIYIKPEHEEMWVAIGEMAESLGLSRSECVFKLLKDAPELKTYKEPYANRDPHRG